ncbi:MAG: hypothetical protein MN733_10320, partial [Nitrososphaera sp.]|nr:hypothetical protein [Nitrososphaera sp.]
MNTYDKNFLFRLSYALTRRFALIPVDVPLNEDTQARHDEREKLWQDVQHALKERSIRDVAIDELKESYNETLMTPLYDQLVTAIRAQPGSPVEGLGRSIGFAQIAAALRHAIIEVELGIVGSGGTLEALDRGVRSSIVPQLEGLSNSALQDFLTWWQNQDLLNRMNHSIMAVRQLMRGAGLFLTE